MNVGFKGLGPHTLEHEGLGHFGLVLSICSVVCI
jgi:hypothetical protein